MKKAWLVLILVFSALPSFMEAKAQPSESEWALFRDAQMKALLVPTTGKVVTYDIGEWNDIHPLNKKEVGVRLALAAGKVAYGDGKGRGTEIFLCCRV